MLVNGELLFLMQREGRGGGGGQQQQCKVLGHWGASVWTWVQRECRALHRQGLPRRNRLPAAAAMHWCSAAAGLEVRPLELDGFGDRLEGVRRPGRVSAFAPEGIGDCLQQLLAALDVDLFAVPT